MSGLDSGNRMSVIRRRDETNFGKYAMRGNFKLWIRESNNGESNNELPHNLKTNTFPNQ